MRLLLASSSNESSWVRATKLLVEIASHGESTGYEIPFVIVAAKDDLDSYPTAIQDSTRVCIFINGYNCSSFHVINNECQSIFWHR